MDRSFFRHAYRLQVRNYEVDWQGIVHNATYLLYFEISRIDYLKQLGLEVDSQRIRDEARVSLVRNEINYRNPLTFDDSITVYTRINFIRNSSFGFEGLIYRDHGDLLIAENVAIHVWLDPETNRPVRVRDNFRESVRRFEGDRVRISLTSQA